MQRTISGMIGKGSTNHNERKFTAENVDKERIKDNVVFVQEDIKKVYHELFDDAVERYNEKQTRKDRMISNYYEHIRSGKQEKLFHEVIFQIGNKDDMAVGTNNGELAKRILCEFMEGFQERNLNLRVFSAHLHMDEATPHLHIDFVPYTTNSKRGVDTRVSMKQALAAQGFKGSGRFDTEYNQWINSEKQQLAKVMERHGIEWQQLGTHKEHLSVLDYKKSERTKEVRQLEGVIQDRILERMDLQTNILDKQSEIWELKTKKQDAQIQAETAKRELKKQEERLNELAPMMKRVHQYAIDFTDAEQVLPEVGVMESGKNYRDKKAKPLFKKLVGLLRSVYAAYLDIWNQFEKLKDKYELLKGRSENLASRVERLKGENMELKQDSEDLVRVKRAYGSKRVNVAIELEKQKEQQEVRIKKEFQKKYDRGAR